MLSMVYLLSEWLQSITIAIKLTIHTINISIVFNLYRFHIYLRMEICESLQMMFDAVFDDTTLGFSARATQSKQIRSHHTNAIDTSYVLAIEIISSFHVTFVDSIQSGLWYKQFSVICKLTGILWGTKLLKLVWTKICSADEKYNKFLCNIYHIAIWIAYLPYTSVICSSSSVIAVGEETNQNHSSDEWKSFWLSQTWIDVPKRNHLSFDRWNNSHRIVAGLSSFEYVQYTPINHVEYFYS